MSGSARAEAERLYGDLDYGYPASQRKSFVSGAEWQASRVGEAKAPSDTDREALARAIYIASDDFAYTDLMAKAWDAPGVHGRARWYRYADAVLAAGFSRSQPVQVEDAETKLGLLLWHLTDGRMSGTGYDVDTMVREVEAAFERNADPVRVEVTDDMVERAHSARLNFKSTRSPNNSRNAMRSALESALGGGDR